MDLTAEKNFDHNKLLLSNLQQLFSSIKQGGGKKRLDKLFDVKDQRLVSGRRTDGKKVDSLNQEL